MPTYIWKNTETGELLELLAKIVDRDIPPSEPGSWTRVPQAPLVLQASFLDGQRARSDNSFIKLKKAAELKVAHANSENKGERAEITKEITKLEKL